MHIQYIDAIQLLRMYDILLIIQALITAKIKLDRFLQPSIN